MLHNKKNIHIILISAILSFILSVVFFVISIQSLIYTNSVKNNIESRYEEFITESHTAMLAEYSQETSFMASQKSVVDILVQSFGEVKTKTTEALIPFEYFLLSSPTFLQGYIVNTQGAIIREIAKDSKKNNTQASPTTLSIIHTALNSKTVVTNISEDSIVYIAMPVYSAELFVGVVVMEFSATVFDEAIASKLIKKQTEELETDLFNRKEFIYVLIILGAVFFSISILFLIAYKCLENNSSLFGLLRGEKNIVNTYDGEDTIVDTENKEEKNGEDSSHNNTKA